ncbi:MAG: DegT/DnrJ/EryC1/StrS family aminotransferase [Chloroflexi bacterium]|nr:DegT/DnrJ/EryC1/StrS family aminotransferase [Chloroflexota bacterium]
MTTVVRTDTLAIEGGTPAVTLPWTTGSTGAQWIDEDERREILDVLDRKSLYRFYGPQKPDKVATLEREFAAYIGTRWALGVTSGTAALKVALVGLGIGPGDEVIVPAITFIASAGAVLSHRAYCVFAECDESFGLDPDDVARKITPRTKAIMPVHLGGVPCKMDEVMAVARARDVKVIEDCAQSGGASYKGKKVGSIGDAGAFSLQLQKIFTAGEGGLISTSDPVVYERSFRYHDQGGYRYGREGVRVSGSTEAAGAEENAPPPAQLAPIVGEVYRMGELAGAVALAQFRKADRIMAKARANKRRVSDGIAGLEGKGLRFREIPDPAGDAGIRIGVILDDPSRTEAFCRAMRAEGVPVSNVYGGKPVYEAGQILHRRPSWAVDDEDAARRPLVPVGGPYGPPIEYEMGMCPRTEALLARAVSLDVSSTHLTDAHLDGAVRAFHKVSDVLL